MANINKTALVPYSAEQMIKLVNDIESYPDFLPGCTGSKILENQEDYILASVDVSKAGISKTFTTKNTTSNENIIMDLVDGPFSRLNGQWSFIKLDDSACKIEFRLDFEFKNYLIEFAFGKIFKELANNMVVAFTNRARDIYN